MKRKKLFFVGIIMILGLGLGLGLNAATSDITISGNVSSSDDESPIEGVLIQCVEYSNYKIETNENGDYEITIPRSSSLSASKPGFHVTSGSSQSRVFTTNDTWDLTMSSRSSGE